MRMLKTLTFIFQDVTILSKQILIWQANCQRNWTYLKQTSSNKCTYHHSIAEKMPLLRMGNLKGHIPISSTQEIGTYVKPSNILHIVM